MMQTLRGLWWNRHVRRWVVAAVLLSQAVSSQIKAYVPELTPVFTFQEGWGICEWRADNRLQITDQSWPDTRFLYDPQAEVLKSQGGLPSSYSFISPRGSVFPPRFMELYSPDSFFSTSPDGRYTVYPFHDRYNVLTPFYDMPRPHVPLVLVDHKTATSIIISELHPSPYVVEIQWNLSSNAFALIEMGGYGGDPYVFYVHGFEKTLDNVQVKQISGYNEVAFDWSLEQLFDIDSTGRYILAAGYFSRAERNAHEQRLLLIDMQELSHTVIAQDRFFGAVRFEQPGDRVLYVNKNGLFAFDRTTGTNELLNAEVSDLNIDFKGQFEQGCRPTISPDGRFLAFDQYEGDADVFVWPIKSP